MRPIPSILHPAVMSRLPPAVEGREDIFVAALFFTPDGKSTSMPLDSKLSMGSMATMLSPVYVPQVAIILRP